jgi:DNA-binding HxlR family transcriptional regulator
MALLTCNGSDKDYNNSLLGYPSKLSIFSRCNSTIATPYFQTQEKASISSKMKGNGKEWLTMSLVYVKCPVELAVDVLSGKWKVLALWYLQDRRRRFNELQRLMPGVSQKMLTHQLRELERDGIIGREVFDENPPRVEYYLTKRGEAVKPILNSLCSWGLSVESELTKEAFAEKASVLA